MDISRCLEKLLLKFRSYASFSFTYTSIRICGSESFDYKHIFEEEKLRSVPPSAPARSQPWYHHLGTRQAVSQVYHQKTCSGNLRPRRILITYCGCSKFKIKPDSLGQQGTHDTPWEYQRWLVDRFQKSKSIEEYRVSKVQTMSRQICSVPKLLETPITDVWPQDFAPVYLLRLFQLQMSQKKLQLSF